MRRRMIAKNSARSRLDFLDRGNKTWIQTCYHTIRISAEKQSTSARWLHIQPSLWRWRRSKLILRFQWWRVLFFWALRVTSACRTSYLMIISRGVLIFRFDM